MREPKPILVVLLVLVGGVSLAQGIRSVDDFKAEAAAAVNAISVEDSRQLVDEDSVVFVDVREADEIARLGKIEGSVHVPRGVLEFYIDPKSSMHMDIFSSGKRVVFYCATSGRSLLAAKVAKRYGRERPGLPRRRIYGVVRS